MIMIVSYFNSYKLLAHHCDMIIMYMSVKYDNNDDVAMCVYIVQSV